MSNFPNQLPDYRTGYMLEGGKSCVTPVARLSYCNLIVPQAMKNDDGSPKLDPTGAQLHEYNCVALFPLDADFTHMHALLADVLVNGKQKFGMDNSKWPPGFLLPFIDQASKQQDGYIPGAKYINLSSRERKPEVLDLDGATRITDATQLYSGCYVRFIVNAYDFKNKSKGLKFGLQGVQKIANGDPLGSAVRVQGAFRPVAAAAPQSAPAGAPAGAPAVAQQAANLFG